ncbi:hypothetical protein IAE37_001815 [Pseudomonas sp. S31]|uniref:hypothetical protein n=1 Tax=Pseudomonas sp. S31 TaxID=1564473 RepID=UPI0019135D59|nr:hypothetical protein [Pseudomonas sp. S31]MBK4999539.1 hypothetical protein [Pseudomonas sp. S31]
MFARATTITTLFFTIAAQGAVAADAERTARSVTHHVAPCVAATQLSPGDNNSVCQVSGVIRSGEALVFANDKPIPVEGNPAIFSLPLADGKVGDTPLSYLHAPAIDGADKFEALTSTADGRYIIASTAFIRSGTENDPKDDKLNAIVYWPADAVQKAKVLEPMTRGGITSSINLRKQISEATGSGYFKVESLAVAPGNQLVLGIRKHGNSSRDSAHSFLLIAAPFHLNKDVMKLTGTFHKILDAKLSVPQQTRLLGLSGLVFDSSSDRRFYAVTSMEDDQGIGGYLWEVPWAEGKAGEPILVKDANGEPLRFANKPEGITTLGSHQLLVVHDDDQIQVQTSLNGIAHRPNEFAYSIIKF